MENLHQCPICRSAEFKPFLSCIDYTVSKESFSLTTCQKCGFVFTNPRPEVDQLGKYYESDEYISHSNTSKGLVNSLYQKVRRRTLRQKLSLINRYSPTGTLLDVGCGTGDFLNTCAQAGWKTTGLEPSASARNLAVSRFGLDVKDEPEIKNLPRNQYDVITLWHVLEHVPFLQERAAELKALLKPGGTLIIAVPNRLSHDAMHYREYWAAYDVPRHLYHFTPNDIRYLFDQHGMQVVKILPMKFDSYYVSMLSEKYRHGKSRLVAAVWRGFVSNLKAMGKPRYSSQIYVLKNKA